MRYINDPRQNRLFDVFENILSPLAHAQLLGGWQHVFRETILRIMPVDNVKKHFDPVIGQPTKELYSVCGLIFIMEFKNWTAEDAAQAYMFHADIQYALNLDPENQSLSSRTVERYKRLIVEDELAGRIMEEITTALVEKLQLNIKTQRLDSTHVFSDMAQFGRTRMMGVTIKRFLTQLRRHDAVAHDTLPEELRKRYRPSGYLLFGDTKKDDDSRRLLREQVARDMHDLIERFGDDEKHNTRSTFAMVVRVFHEQCEVIEDKIEIRKHPGGNVIQNPSDPDATRDGKKGPGYQVQLAETCDDENDVQLITAAIPQTAAEHDSNAVEPVLDALEKSGTMPESMLGDTAYGSDDNVQACEEKDVELVSPTPGKRPEDAYATNSDDFVVDETRGEVESCPRGEQPLESNRDEAKGQTIVVMEGATCDACEHRDACPVHRRKDGNYEFSFNDKQRRLDARRREEETDVFRERYRKRSGIEATNSILKRVTGLGRLRVRGSPGVFHSILLKVAGWNLLQAARALAMRQDRQIAAAFG
jgi:hypothetical protein